MFHALNAGQHDQGQRDAKDAQRDRRNRRNPVSEPSPAIPCGRQGYQEGSEEHRDGRTHPDDAMQRSEGSGDLRKAEVDPVLRRERLEPGRTQSISIQVLHPRERRVRDDR